MARLQRDFDAAYPESSSTFMWWIGDNYAGNLGPLRNQRLKPFQTYLRKRVQWSGGSDYPVTPFAARYGLWASVARETLNGTYGATPFGIDESVDVKAALRSYTRWAAARCSSTTASGQSRSGRMRTSRYGSQSISGFHSRPEGHAVRVDDRAWPRRVPVGPAVN